MIAKWEEGGQSDHQERSQPEKKFHQDEVHNLEAGLLPGKTD
jgi:hypothetical protein